ncbi:MAG: hypothetical protein NTX49_01925 [Chlamydiae bacterium]|nr:hypothetical protein [Chlamydiota bacterium]
MSSFQNPIQRSEDGGIEKPQAISPIEKDKKENKDYNETPEELWENEQARSVLITTLFSTIKKLINKLGTSSDLELTNPDVLKKDLESIRDLLQSLCHNDESHNAEFLYNLSELWHGLLSDFGNVDISSKDNLSIAHKISALTTDILNFPPEEDHSLGYYLTEHAGREWIPFPLMDLLQDLHRENQKDPENSKLNFWIAALNNIIDDLDSLGNLT